jgi:acyl-CoA reductase-like NAD-dependent aldehyde dehydrogenase
MAKYKKVTVRTPATVYIKMLQRAFELNLTNREYYLAVAMKDLGLIGEGEELTETNAAKIKAYIKELDEQEKKNTPSSKPHDST